MLWHHTGVAVDTCLYGCIGAGSCTAWSKDQVAHLLPGPAYPWWCVQLATVSWESRRKAATAQNGGHPDEDGIFEYAGDGASKEEEGGIFVVLHGIVRSSYVAPDGSSNVRHTPVPS